MDELVECIVKSKVTPGAYIGRCFSVGVALTALCLSLVIGINAPVILPVALIVDLIIGFIIFFVFRNTSIEYEYDFFGGEMTVDKILGKSKRKRIETLNFTQFEYLAPSNSPRFENNERGNASYADYSDHDFTKVSYTALFHCDGKQSYYVKFSPNDELLSLLKKLYPRKVSED